MGAEWRLRVKAGAAVEGTAWVALPSFMPLSCPCSILIRFISNPMAPTWWGFLVAGLMFVCALMQTVILHQYYHCMFAMGLRLRTGIIGVIYRKVSWNEAQWGRLALGSFGEALTVPEHHLLSTCRLWLSPAQSNVSPLWEKWSTSCLWMPSASWTSPPFSTCCGQHLCRSYWQSTSSGR